MFFHLFGVNQKGRPSRSARRLQFESLESRTLLAGDVRAAVRGGDLILLGTNDANEIQIEAGPSVDSVIITPLGGTTVNGGGEPVQLNGITDDFRIHLRDGQNRISVPTAAGFGPLAVPDELRIAFRHGDNNVSLAGAVNVGGDTLIRAGDGSNTVSIGTNVDIGGDLRVHAGNGGNTILLSPLRVGDDLIVRSGRGGDTVQLNGDVGNKLDLRTSDGDDRVTMGALLYNPPRYSPGSSVPITVAGRASVELGQGDDEFVGVVEGGRFVAISSDGGHNQIELFAPKTNHLRIETAAGNDHVAVLAGTLDRLTIQTGAGDDSIEVLQDTAPLSADPALIDFVYSSDGEIVVPAIPSTPLPSIIGRMLVRAGDGNDRLVIDETSVDRAFFDLGDGDDAWFMHRSSVNRVVGKMLNGDDHLSISCAGVFGGGVIDGGNGHNVASGTLDVSALVRNFQAVGIFEVDANFCNNPLAF